MRRPRGRRLRVGFHTQSLDKWMCSQPAAIRACTTTHPIGDRAVGGREPHVWWHVVFENRARVAPGVAGLKPDSFGGLAEIATTKITRGALVPGAHAAVANLPGLKWCHELNPLCTSGTLICEPSFWYMPAPPRHYFPRRTLLGVEKPRFPKMACLPVLQVR